MLLLLEGFFSCLYSLRIVQDSHLRTVIVIGTGVRIKRSTIRFYGVRHDCCAPGLPPLVSLQATIANDPKNAGYVYPACCP